MDLYIHFSIRPYGMLQGHFIFTYISVNVIEVGPNYSSVCSQHQNYREISDQLQFTVRQTDTHVFEEHSVIKFLSYREYFFIVKRNIMLNLYR